MSVLLLAAGIALAVLGWWVVAGWRHRCRVEQLRWRVHVNGIRGKSTVTRLIAGSLREAGIVTIGKSTGTAAAVINRAGDDEPIDRHGPATILEQLRVVRAYVTTGVEALVVECMALKPEYQRASERQIVRSTIGVLTNVRHDHQDVMGETLVEIATSLLETCPRNGVLVTAEQNLQVLEVVYRVAGRNGTRVVVVDPEEVTDEEVGRFDFVSFKENVAIALAVAALIGVGRATAMDGMVAANPDPGVLRIFDVYLGSTRVTWANLFAVNDRESMITAMDRLTGYRTADTVTIGILNNRLDRERRAIQFADIAVNDLDFDRLVTFGAYEKLVTNRLLACGYRNPILNLGDDRRPTAAEMIEAIVTDQHVAHVLLVGFVNIHTDQAELLMHHLDDPALRAPPIIDLTAVAETVSL